MASPARPYEDTASDAVRGRILLLLALLVTVMAYLATLRFAFVYDDTPQIVLNSTLTNWATLPTLFASHSWKFLMPDLLTNYYRPLFMSWLLVNRKLFDLYTPAWHATTVLVHLVATWLAFVVARQLMRSATNAGFVAILFGLHPIHVEGVAWVSGVTEPLMAAFVLAAFWAWIESEREPEHGLFYKLLAAVFFAAGCLCKETALLFPIVVVAHDVLRGQFNRDAKGLLQAALRATPLWIIAVAYLAVRAIVLRGLLHPANEPISHVLLSVPTIFWGYMRRLVWPVHLSVFYATPPVTSPLQVRFWLPLAALIFSGIIAWRIGTRSRLAGLAMVWILVFLAPAFVGLPVFVRGEWIHDRYLYLPSFGFCLLVVLAIAQIPSKREIFHLPAAPTAIVLLLAAAMAFATSIEELPWTNDFTLFLHAALLQPDSPQAQSHLATEFYRRGDVPDAEQRYQNAIRLNPSDWKNRLAYGLMLFYTGQFEKSDSELQKAIAIQPYDSNEYFYQGMSRFNQGHYPQAEQAFSQAITTGPARSRYHFWLGFTYEKEGRFNQAKSEYQKELTLHPETDTQVRERLEGLEGKPGN